MILDLFGKFFDGIGLQDQSAVNRLLVVLVPIDETVAYDRDAQADQGLRRPKLFIENHPRRRARIGERRDVEMHGGLVEEVAARIVRHLRFRFVALTVVIDHDGVGAPHGRGNRPQAHAVEGLLRRNDHARCGLTHLLQPGAHGHTHGNAVTGVGGRPVERPTVDAGALKEGLTHSAAVFVTARAEHHGLLGANENLLTLLHPDGADDFALGVFEKFHGRGFPFDANVLTLLFDAFR